jgi:hypothetical protein
MDSEDSDVDKPLDDDDSNDELKSLSLDDDDDESFMFIHFKSLIGMGADGAGGGVGSR